MKILTIPFIFGGNSHLIPLFVLHQRYLKRSTTISNYFLLAKENYKDFSSLGINVLDIDYSLPYSEQGFEKNKEQLTAMLFSMESEACDQICPDIIIEDNCFSSIIVSERLNIPRISIHRTGFFRSLPLTQRNSSHVHSLIKGENKDIPTEAIDFVHDDNPNKLNNEKKDIFFLEKYLEAKTKIIPGIPSIEVLPHDIPLRESYFYSGPLTVEDNPSEILKSEFEHFLQGNKYRKKVFISTGLVDKTAVTDYINYLLENDYAVITTTKNMVDNADPLMFFENRFLPLHYVCGVCDLIIHQCGSGMYHYPILNLKPAITLGTQCYDREDVALRLAQLGVSKHVDHPADNVNHLTTFKKHMESFENNTLHNPEMLERLKTEIYETMMNFDMDEVIKYTIKK